MSGGTVRHGLLEGWPRERLLARANAAGAIAASRQECSGAMPAGVSIESVLGEHGGRVA